MPQREASEIDQERSGGSNRKVPRTWHGVAIGGGYCGGTIQGITEKLDYIQAGLRFEQGVKG